MRAARVFGWALGALGLAAWGAMVASYWTFTVDDAFIFLRYAEHVAIGEGPTWNPGAPVAEGYTSPLWLAVLSLATLVRVDPLLAAKSLGVALMLSALALAGGFARELTRERDEAERTLAAGTAIFVLGTLPASAIHAVSGMETALATCLAIAYALALTRAATAPSGTRAALAAGLGLGLSLARPEANLLVAVASLVALGSMPAAGRATWLRSIVLLHAVPGAIYLAWRISYYGHLLPLPFYVKALVPEETLPGASEAIAFVRSTLLDRADLGFALGMGIVAAPRLVAPALSGALALWAFFFWPAHEMGYDFRYFHPITPILAGVIALGVVVVWSWLSARARASAWVAPAVVTLSAAQAVLPCLAGSIQEKCDYGAGVAHAHVPLGLALAEATDQVERPVVATLDCGAIAYHSRWTVIDTWGLNDPAIATTGRRDAERVLDQRPEVVIVISSQRERFAPHFEHERALWDGAHELGLAHVASFEFLPDYHLFVLARPGSAAAGSLARAGEAPLDVLVSARSRTEGAVPTRR